ncbi:MAG: heavy-metal-associated domain-containing protein [Gemmobacter sp.]
MRVHVPDMSCGHCKTAVEAALRKVDPDAAVAVDLAGRTVDVTSSADPAAILAALDAAGFPAERR